MMRAIVFLAAMLLALPTYGQTRQPAQITTLPSATPQPFDILDKTGFWVPFGKVDATTHGFSPATSPNTIDVMSAGAKCDGTTDDRAAIQSAINAVGLMAGGGTVIIPPSTNGCKVNGTLTITKGNVVLAGTHRGSILLFDNGAADSIVVGNGRGTPQLYFNEIRDLRIDHNVANETGGYGIKFVSTSQSRITNVYMENVYNGLAADQINNLIVDKTTIRAKPNSPGIGIAYVTAGDGSVRSDVFTLNDTAVSMLNDTTAGHLRVTSECIRVDGASMTIRMKSVTALQCGYGLRIMNSSGTTSSAGHPAFGVFQGLEIEAGITAVRIEAGHDWLFSNSIVNTYWNNEPTDVSFEVFPDSTGSVTRDIIFNGSIIGSSPGICLRINGVKGFYLSGSQVGPCGTRAGPNSILGPQPKVVAVEVGAQSQDFVATGNQIGYWWGEGNQDKLDYAVRIKNGAVGTILSANNYRMFGGVGMIDSLAGADSVSIMGGLDIIGKPFGSVFSQVSAGGAGFSYPGNLNKNVIVNAGTTSNSGAEFTTSTGTANAFLLMRSTTNGTTPSGLLQSGSGNTGGLLIESGAGDVKLQPNSGNVQFTDNGSFDSNKANCGNIAASTGCLIIKDNTGAVRKTPLF